MELKEENIVKRVCKEFNITQAELSRKLDVSSATVSDWSKGNIPKMAELALILMLENKEIKEHLENVKNFYNTLQKI
ncbi:helix-turn-helix transcriptional regulator [Arcobacter cryaerophilus gv. pseudocryaerophilus]|uniref:Helix-turn-helix transcriptional regulator n=2 Tax=Arcobacteraceae TaxID=2808963 RepID=A0AAU0P558_9BACT|nr:helix-turn-helix transcriptional regulator [Arcobacter sp. AZ-2023]WPD03384.1 helix-turn-helix transcriptional regulator [Arcobacter sp. DSM 115972]